VEDFDSSSMRVSLTVEQYKLPEQLYWAAPGLELKRIRY
jgi:hypothetical protein